MSAIREKHGNVPVFSHLKYLRLYFIAVYNHILKELKYVHVFTI